MPPRHGLKTAAYSLRDSFISRNNDVRRCWALGKLYSHALKSGVEVVEIDLLARTITPPTDLFEGLIEKYSNLLLQWTTNDPPSPNRLSEARIRIRFNIKPFNFYDSDPFLPPRDTWGELYECTVEVKGSLSGTYTARARGWCGRS